MTVATRDYHPSRMTTTRSRVASARGFRIPDDVNHLDLSIAGKELTLTNLNKPFWPDLGISKRDLIQYYADVSAYLLPHLRDRAMVMKRYPHGAYGKFFFMKRAPVPRPAWIETCSIE